MADEPNDLPATWEGLLALASRLRSPQGCPWDRAQTLRTLAPYLIEEAFEVLGAVEEEGRPRVREEIGDLFFVLSLVVVVAQDEGAITSFADLARVAIEKIRRRHPHVFGESPLSSPAEVERQWDEIKRGERGETEAGALPPLDPALPALRQAEKLQRRAASGGFDWKDARGVISKIREELVEVEELLGPATGAAEPTAPQARRTEEVGDLLFAVTSLARHLEVDPEFALRSASDKFRRRHSGVVAHLAALGLRPEGVDAATLDRAWEAVKATEVGSSPDPQP